MIAVVTGASSGFGYDICRKLKERGYVVYGVSRRGTVPEGVNGLSVDIMCRKDIDNAIASILEKEGRIDILVNNAGMGISGPLEFVSEKSAEHILNVNFLGALSCTQAVLPTMRTQGSGCILFVSSVAAEIAVPYQAMYSATKAAVMSAALALRNEVREFGIKVAVVSPGDACTGFTDSREKESSYDSIYCRNSSATASMEKDERSGMSSEYVAESIVRTALAKNPRPVTVVGRKYRVFCDLFRFLPTRFSYWIVGKMYS